MSEIERDVTAQIAAMRDQIDEVDTAIIELVRVRTDLSASIARLKRMKRIPIIDGNREGVIFRRYAIALGNLGKQLATALLTRRTREIDPPEKK